MTQEDFRADEVRVVGLKNALADPFLQEALLIIHDSRSVVDVPDQSGVLASARKLSNLAGRADVIRELYEMATTLTVPGLPKRPDYGVTEAPPQGWNPEQL